jgi:hypothetical protein
MNGRGMSKLPRKMVIGVAIIGILTTLLGLLYTFKMLVTAFTGGFAQTAGSHRFQYFYLAFYSMSGICIVCQLTLLRCSLDLFYVRFRFFRLFAGILIFEIAYVFLIGCLWLCSDFGMSIAAATGVANCGIGAQFIIMFPFWAPVTLYWAKRKLELSKGSDQSFVQ